MCTNCANAVRKHFPLATDKQKMNLLWCGTCFPADHGDRIEEMLAELEVKSNGEYELAMDITHREFDEIWEKTRHLRPRWDENEQRWIEPEEQQETCQSGSQGS